MYLRYGIISRLILLHYTKFTTVNQPLVNPNFENFFVDKQQRILRFHTVYTFFKLIIFIHLRITEFCESVSFVQPYRSFVVRLCFKTDSCNIGIFLFNKLKKFSCYALALHISPQATPQYRPPHLNR